MSNVDWDAVDALFKFFESPSRGGRALNGYFVSGFVAAAVMVDANGDVGAWWRALRGSTDRADGRVDALIRRGFVENWRDVAAGFERGRFAPPVPAPDEADHEEALADFCDGFLQALDSSSAALAIVAESSPAARAVAVLRRRVAARSAPAPNEPAALRQVVTAQRELWPATRGLRRRGVEAAPLRAA